MCTVWSPFTGHEQDWAPELLGIFKYVFPFISPLQYPFSNLKLALQKLKQEEAKSRELKQIFRAADRKHTKKVDYNTFR